MKKRKPRKDGRYSINLSFTEQETDLIAHVDERGNFSAYVKYLIRKDMEGSGANALDLIQGLLKDNIQKGKQEQPAEEPQKPKANISKINKILSKSNL